MKQQLINYGLSSKPTISSRVLNISAGFNLVELISVVAICSITLSLAAPSFTHLRIANRVTAQLSKLSNAVNLARTSAILKNTIITLCRSQSFKACDGKWVDGLIVFTDQNKNRIVDSTELVLLSINAFPKDDIIHWRSFRNKQYLQMNPEGYTRFQNGTFTYCPKEGLSYARAIIINASGRFYFSKDSDGDGIDEGSNGKPLKC